MAKKRVLIHSFMEEKQKLKGKNNHPPPALLKNFIMFTGTSYNTNNNGKHTTANSGNFVSSDMDGTEVQMKQTKSRNIFKAGKHKAKHAPILSPTAKRASVKLMSSFSWTPNYGASPTVPDSRSASVADLEEICYPAECIPPSPGMTNVHRRSSKHRVSYKKAIQRAGCNMTELDGTGSGAGAVSPGAARREAHVFTSVDWTDNAIPDHHIWSPTSASGDLCYVGEENCQKSGPRKRCSACHIVVHELCFNQFAKIGFPCKTTFRECTSKSMRESLVVHHHWVHRRKLEGKCRQCGKAFEKRFGFREPTKIIAISCSWCKEAYHNKVHCFQLQKINEPCNLGALSKSIVPSTWIIKSPKQKSARNRSKRRSRSSSGTSKKRSTKENRTKPFLIRPLSHQAAFVCPTLVFINPKSGGRQGAKILQAFHWYLNPRQVFDLSKEGPREPLELFRKVPNLRVLACGGDGTVGWILSVLDKLNLPHPRPPVAVLPLGTGNDLSRTLNFGHGYTDEPIHKIIQGVEEARMVKLDRWKLTVEKNEESVKTNDEEEFHPPLVPDFHSAGVDRLPLDVINNYFGIGSDAQVTLNFHESREAHPAKFTSRFGNKFFYARAGVFEYLTRQSKDLSKHITVECDGVDFTPKIRELKPVSIVFLNIPRFSSGTIPWGNPTGVEFKAQRHDDKLIEVLAFSLNQLGMIFVGGHGERLTQCRSATIKTTKALPVQIDGEPCKLNPSIIHLDFLNQANMLTKSKRGNEIQSAHEQIKIRVNAIHKDNFDAFKGAMELLSVNATPLLVTVVMNQSTLDTVRSCLLLIMSEIEKTSHPISEKWMFLDSSGTEKFYTINRSRESHLVVSDVMTRDREVYILDIPGDMQHSKSTTSSLSTLDYQSSWYRNRIRSDSGVFKSNSSVFESLAQTDGIEEEIKLNGVAEAEFCEFKPSDSAAASLDVVFEQTEDGLRSLLHEDLPDERSFTIGDDYENLPISLTRSSPALSHLRQNPNRSDSDCSSNYSTSSNEYILTDESTASPSKNRKSPLKIAYSNPPVLSQSLVEEFSSHLTLDESNETTTKPHIRSKTDSDASSVAGFSLSPSQMYNVLQKNRNQSNNNEKRAKNHKELNCVDTDTNQVHEKSFVDSSEKIAEEKSSSLTSQGIEETKLTETKEEKESDSKRVCLWNKIFLDAAKRGDLEKMQKCITHGAQLNSRDEEGCTALHHAVRHAYDHIFDWLIQTGDIHFFNLLCHDRKQTALHKAAWYGRTEMCEKLLNAGASLKVQDYKIFNFERFVSPFYRNINDFIGKYLLSGLKAVDRAKQSDVQGLVELFLKCEALRTQELQETHL